tara:strand:- start:794 stop:1009 length:216 start_codon:yes stop_codon:yes gene_type:complete
MSFSHSPEQGIKHALAPLRRVFLCQLFQLPGVAGFFEGEVLTAGHLIFSLQNFIRESPTPVFTRLIQKTGA